MALYLTEADVHALVDMSDAIPCIEEVFGDLGRGDAVNHSRQRLNMPHGKLHLMMAAAPRLKVMGLKAYTTYPAGSRFHVSLYSTDTGELLALIEGIRHGELRTGAASGVATKYLARREAQRVGVIGSGAHARTQLAAVSAVRKLREAVVFSPNAEHRQRYAKEMSAALELTVNPVDTAQAAVEGMDVVITATKSATPVLNGEWLAAGAHVNAMGSNALNRAEVDAATVERAALIAADSVDQLRLEGGDVLSSILSGKLQWGQIAEMGRIVAGHHPGRQAEDGITLFKSSGLAAQDVAFAAVIYQRAVERGIGKKLP